MPRYLINFGGLVLFHINNLLSLNELVGVGSGNIRGRMTGVFFPDNLNFRGRHENYEQMTDVRVRRIFEHADVILRRDHRLNLVGKSQGRAGLLRFVQLAIL